MDAITNRYSTSLLRKSRAWGYLRLFSDGSFTLFGALYGPESIWRVEYQAGIVSILAIAGRNWREATVRTGHARWRPNRLCMLQAARSSQGDGVEANSTWWSSSGSRKKRTFAVDAAGGRHWSFDQHFSNGSSLYGTGKKTLGGPASVVQKRVSKDGKVLWESTCTFSLQENEKQRRTIRSETKFANGGRATNVRIVEPAGPAGLPTRDETTKYNGGPFAGSTSETSVHVEPDGSQVTQTVVTFPDGSMQITTERERGAGVGQLTTDLSSGKETTTIGIDSEGKAGVVSKSDSSSQTNEDTGVTSGVFHDSYTNQAGQTVETTVSWASSPEGTSTTTSTPTEDGGSEVVTITTDNEGYGSKHTTRVDQDGNAVPGSDNTSPVTPDSPSGPDQSSQPAQPDEPDQPDEPPNPDDNSGDDKGTGGEGDKGMDWEGNDDGRPSVLPKHTASIFDALQGPTGDAGEGGEGVEALNVRIARALTGVAIAPGSPNDTGYGDAGGSESFADITLSEASILSVVKVKPPTDDWGEWNDPRVHVAYIGSLLSVLANTVGVTRHGLSKSLLSIQRLSGEVASITSRANE